MAGHSHSANIAVRKGKQDAKRASQFAKLSKNIMIAARKGPDPDSNFGLRHAIDLARAASMPKDKIEHDVKTDADVATGKKVLALLEELDEHDDVNAVHSSLKMTDEMAAAS